MDLNHLNNIQTVFDTVVAENAFDGCGEIVVITPEGSMAETALSGKPNITIEHIP